MRLLIRVALSVGISVRLADLVPPSLASVRDVDPLLEKHRRNLSPHTVSSSTMEHRTLKQRENLLTGRKSPQTSISAREQHMRSLHELVQSIEGFQADKSRNSTITLNSTRGVVSQDCGTSDLELPPPAKIVPFSCIKPQDNGIIRPIAFRPLANNAGLRHNRHSQSPDSHLKPNTIQEWPRDFRMRSTNQLFGCKSIGSLPTTADENAYDVVPEYINEPNSTDPNYSSIYPFQPHSHRAHSQNASKRQHNFFSTTHSNTTTSTSSGSTTSPHNRLKKSISGSQQNVQGHSNNPHVTPSPSDSGIILDYEKVLIRVYQDKERQYKQQVEELKQRLHTVQQGETALRKQIRQSEDARQQLQKSVQSLNDEKLEMQQKCVQIERELAQLRVRVDEHRPCDTCRRAQSQQTQSIYENNGLSSVSNGIKPVPAPRLVNSKEQDLRSEVDDLKSEVSMLREQLNRQVEFFADRKRWDQNPTHLPVDSSHLNNNLPNKKPTHFSSAINGFGQQRSLSEKRPILSTATDRLI
ncbi:hypothetical protein M3Y97_00272600 [Aphelenchoides bicaudatus]|nr:hypothetical protein M3Y97_00272600 [Aphelenchoides bicaudatus]